MHNYQFELQKLKDEMQKNLDSPDKQLALFEKFCDKFDLKPDGPFPKSEQELIEMQQRGVAPDLESVLEVYAGIKGRLEENVLSKDIDRTLDQRNREDAGLAPQAEGHVQQAENTNPDPDWPPKPKSANWPPKP